MNNIFITLDYELFFGRNSGTQEKSIIYPTNRLVSVLDKYQVKASFFVDSGYLIKLKEYKQKYPGLEKDYQEIVGQIQKLHTEGHDIQLHIHPHWEDSSFDGQKWNIDTTRYRLNSFNEQEIDDIVFKYTEILKETCNNEIFTFRAGGWCIQPFNKLEKAFKANKIWLDSTIYKNGKNNSETHFFDFKNSPDKTLWRFEKDPLVEQKDGYFYEIPISSYKVSPLFFWKLAFYKKNNNAQYKSFGDGSAAGGSKWDKLRMLTVPSNTVVSIDGFKASLLNKSFAKFRQGKQNANFVIIGHPKALSENSLQLLDEFLAKESKNNKFHTYTSWVKENQDTLKIK